MIEGEDSVPATLGLIEACNDHDQTSSDCVLSHLVVWFRCLASLCCLLTSHGPDIFS